jgi:hypothetical protein
VRLLVSGNIRNRYPDLMTNPVDCDFLAGDDPADGFDADAPVFREFVEGQVGVGLDGHWYSSFSGWIKDEVRSVSIAAITSRAHCRASSLASVTKAGTISGPASIRFATAGFLVINIRWSHPAAGSQPGKERSRSLTAIILVGINHDVLVLEAIDILHAQNGEISRTALVWSSRSWFPG